MHIEESSLAHNSLLSVSEIAFNESPLSLITISLDLYIFFSFFSVIEKLVILFLYYL